MLLFNDYIYLSRSGTRNGGKHRQEKQSRQRASAKKNEVAVVSEVATAAVPSNLAGSLFHAAECARGSHCGAECAKNKLILAGILKTYLFYSLYYIYD